MAEALSFSLNLDEHVAGPAKKAASALRLVEDQAKKAQKSLDFGKEIERAEHNLKRLTVDPKGFEKMLRVQRELAEQRKKIATGAGLGKESFGEALGKKFNFGLLTSAAFAGDLLAEGALKIGESLIETAKSVVEIFTEGFKKGIEEGAKSQVLQLGAKLSLGAKGGGEFVGDVSRFAKLTGFDDDTIQKMLLPLRRAGLGQQSSRTAFAAATDVAAGEGQGGNAGRVGDLLETFKKIQLKGGVSEKMLISLGVVAKDFYAELGKQLKISPDAAKKKAEEGKIDPQQLLNTVYKGIEKRQGGQLGTGAIAYSNTLESRMNKLKDLPNQYFKTISESAGFSKLSETFGSLLERLDPDGPVGQRIITSLQDMFTKIVGWFDSLTSEDGLDTITSGVESLVTGLGKAVDVATSLVHAFEAAAGVASTLAGPIKAAMEIGNNLLSPTNGFKSQDDLKQDLMKRYASGKITLDDVTKIAGEYAGKFGAPDVASGGGKVIHMTNNVTNNVHAAPGEDPNHTHRKMAEETHRHTLNALEKAAQEGGG